MTLLDQNDLAQRWAINGTPVTDRTIRRHVSRFGLKPKKFTGVQPLYSLSDVLKLERKRTAELLRQQELTSAKIARANRQRKAPKGGAS